MNCFKYPRMVNTDLDMSKYNLHINKQCKSWQDSRATEVNYDEIKITVIPRIGLDGVLSI